MRIGIDIDGVLTDEHRYIIDNGTKFFAERAIKYKVHSDIYDSKELFEVTQEQYNEFWENNIFEYSKNSLIRPFASEIITKLKDDNEIYIITSRLFTTYENEYKEKMQNIVKNWLDKNNIYYNEIIFTDEKADVCKKNNIDVMIEDKPENILAISNEIPVICFDHKYNENLYNNNIYRAYSWYDIYTIIRNNIICS